MPNIAFFIGHTIGTALVAELAEAIGEHSDADLLSSPHSHDVCCSLCHARQVSTSRHALPIAVVHVLPDTLHRAHLSPSGRLGAQAGERHSWWRRR